jgi:hypothetical protein
MKKLTIFLLAAALPLAAHAQKIYMCKDASGRTQTSDRPIPECADRAMKEMDKRGIVRREIAAPLTEAQKLQKEKEQEKLEAEALETAKQKQADKAMLARFANEKEISNARKRNLDVVQDQIKRESAALELAEKSGKAAQEEAAKAKGKTAPAALQRKIDESAQEAAGIKKRIVGLEEEAAQINARFDETTARYRQLTGSSPAPSAAPAAASQTSGKPSASK